MTALLSDKELLGRLVGFPTVSTGPNAPLVDWIADYLDRPGIRITRQEGPEPGKVNLIAEAGPEPESPKDRSGLTLSGHLDVVPAKPEGWLSDPFELTEREGNLYGRGSADMKGFCALAVNRLAAAAGGGAPSARLALLLTFDEELGCLGAHHFARHWPGDRPLPRSLLVGEPTELRVVRMHKGHMTVKVLIRGKSAHTGSPHLGINAIRAAAAVLGSVESLRREWEEARTEHAGHFSEVPFPVLAVSGIRGGEAKNIVPPRCDIDIGIRLMPGMTSDEAVKRVQRAVGGAMATPELEGPAGRPSAEVVAGDESPPLLTPDDALLHRALCDLMGQRRSLGVPYATDGGWLATAGYDCVIWGPGTIDVAHQPNEYLPVAELRRGGELLDRLVHLLCRSGAPAARA
jgi:acetylornithine deacetylase